jgi:hypothetical protein
MQGRSAASNAPRCGVASCPGRRRRRATPGWRLRGRAGGRHGERSREGSRRSAQRSRAAAPRSQQSCTSASSARASALCSAPRSTSGPYSTTLLLGAATPNRCAGAALGGGARGEAAAPDCAAATMGARRPREAERGRRYGCSGMTAEGTEVWALPRARALPCTRRVRCRSWHGCACAGARATSQRSRTPLGNNLLRRHKTRPAWRRHTRRPPQHDAPDADGSCAAVRRGAHGAPAPPATSHASRRARRRRCGGCGAGARRRPSPRGLERPRVRGARPGAADGVPGAAAAAEMHRTVASGVGAAAAAA